MKRGELYPLVVGLLMENPKLRDDDNLLEAAVCRRYNSNFDNMSASEFVVLRDTLGYPSRESIGRIRRLAQENVEELRASDECQRKRTELEKEWKGYVAHG
ncbi:MAG: hypothetical protein J6Y79_04090 [Paludibacteraceae bacterium]|nr:hypothetical protein [Paludibacteraceae bacterium]